MLLTYIKDKHVVFGLDGKDEKLYATMGESPMDEKTADFCKPCTISEEDILLAMQDIQGYLDISPGDFKEVYEVAYRHAMTRLLQGRKAADIMSHHVHCVELSMNMQQAAGFLAGKNISGAPVIDGGGKVVGVVSEKDFLARLGVGKTASFMQIIAQWLGNKGSLATELQNHSIAEIMSAPAITAGPEISVAAISSLFIDRRINRLPIVDGDDRLLGIVTRTDLVNSYCFSL